MTHLIRSASVLYAVLVAATQYGQSLAVSLCNRDGERPVHVRGVSGTYCVPQKLCEGYFSATNEQLLACPRAGQQDVVGSGVLVRDSCCAIVDSDSGKLGCVERKNATLDTACLILPRNRDFDRVNRKKRRGRTLQNSVTSEATFTISVSTPVPPYIPPAVTSAPRLTKVGSTIDPAITTLTPTEAPMQATQVSVEATEGPVSASSNLEASPIETPPPTLSTATITKVPEDVAPMIEDPARTKSIAFDTMDDQQTQAPLLTTKGPPSATQVPLYYEESSALTLAPNISDKVSRTSAPTWSTSPPTPVQNPLTAVPTLNDTTASVEATEVPMMINESLKSDIQPSTVVTSAADISGKALEITDAPPDPMLISSSTNTTASNTTSNASASPNATLISKPAPVAENDASVESTMSPVSTHTLPPGASPTATSEILDENITTPILATEIPETLTTELSRPTDIVSNMSVSADTTSRPTDSVSNMSVSTDNNSPTQSVPTAPSILTPPVATLNLTSPTNSSPAMAMQVLNSGPTSDSIVPEMTITPSQASPPLEPVSPSIISSANSDRPTLAQMNVLPLAPAETSLDLSPDSGASESSSHNFESVNASGCYLRESNCSSSSPASEPTGSFPNYEQTGSMLATYAGASTAGPSFTSNDTSASNDVLQLSPIIDDDGNYSNLPLVDGSLNPAISGSIGGSSEVGNTVTFIIVGCAATIAILFGIFYLRPKRVDTLQLLTPVEAPPLIDRSGYGEYWFNRSVESEPVGPYDASSTPREIGASV
ncbi:uncharacterized protein PHALS_07623 [Plasmopara halstedii]|uniref:Uncharacterized protein n=1 Tax=Plasmopara halstedii TaxID=4781 RepID=A0A0P1B520_PLAHL|nr:uncharacterized protein PHALS_07623 [Plasmopara halstedii]CEG49886.1 hypothetical protein PHALS_07623 [Plasmopara halstedii]|eukprot:XP_024586255.1 hypothetical protein PHALS_07623 [Plasmopara halstedii]